MSNKIYVFGIGGTGSRVLKALTLLLASGVRCPYTVVPIVVDPDESNADVTRTVETIRKYEAIRSKLTWATTSRNSFFGTEISGINESHRLALEGTKDKKFGEYIELGSMDESNRAMMQMLFSENNLEADMAAGFKGNPNIGSVVLNQFAFSADFQNFANGFQQGDKVFIVNSIFGGTGPSGYPLLLKTLRSNDSMPNHALINDAPIGAVTVLPYFKVKSDEESAIDSGTFISKTKSALHYYARGITGNKSIDTQYFIGDEARESYDNNEGGTAQKNKAHFVEMAAALAVLDFAEKGTHPGGTETKEFGIKEEAEQIIFQNLENSTSEMLKMPLSQFAMFCRYVAEDYNDSHKTQRWSKDNGLDRNFRSGPFFQDVASFQKDFVSWMSEMSANRVAFAPLRFSGEWKAMVSGINGKSGLFSSLDGYTLDDKMNRATGRLQHTTKEQMFMELFCIATEEVLREKFNY